MPPKQQTIKSPLSSLLQKINAICILCNEATDTQTLLKDSLQKILLLIRSQRGSIFLLDHQSKELALKASIGMNVDDKKEMIKHLGEGIIGRVAQIKEPLLVEDISKEERFKN